MFSLLVSSGLVMLAQALPPKTYSKVCPAVAFSQESLVTDSGNLVIKFKPDNPSLFFDFVDVHLELEQNGQILGKQVNVGLQRAHRGAHYETVLTDANEMNRLTKRSDVQLKYSFTYCVGINDQPVDCDTEPFLFNPVTYTRRAGLVECPTECGLPESFLTVPSTCLGSDGKVYPEYKCNNIAAPEPVYCAATKPCVTFYWEPLPVTCPAECGFQGAMIPPEVVCMGSDGNTYPGTKCTNLPRPSAVMCPATAACVTFNWRAGLVECPTECGLPETFLSVPIDCMGSDGNVYSDTKCNSLAAPEPVYCAATKPCVTFYWEPLPVTCPAECGFEGAMILPEVVCMGSDGNVYGGEKCESLPRPATVMCPPTESCVTYSWRAALVECPTECGLPASTIEVPVSCLGSDGYDGYDEQCNYADKPAPIQCPATELCPLEPLNPVCPVISFRHGVERRGDSAFTIAFQPLGKDIARRQIDWIDVHISLVDANGMMVRGSEKVNHRMERPTNLDEFVFTHDQISSLAGLGHRGTKLAYSFTYCIEMTDCDTDTFFFEASPEYLGGGRK